MLGGYNELLMSPPCDRSRMRSLTSGAYPMTSKTRLATTCLAVFLPVLAGCSSRGADPAATPAAASAPSARTVGVVTVTQGDVKRTITQPGTIQGIQEAVVYAKTSGYLQSLSVDKGDRVRAGQLLAVIQSPEVQHQQEQARAGYAQSEASALGVAASRGRAQADVAQAAAVVERAKADAREAEAGVARAKADLARAEAQPAKLRALVVEAEANVQQAAEQQGQAQADVARQQQGVKAAQSAVNAAQSVLEKAQADLKLQQLTYNRLKAIQDKDNGLIPAQDVDIARTRMEVSRSDVDTARSRVEAAKQELSATEQQVEAARRAAGAAGKKLEAAKARAQAAKEDIQLAGGDIESARQQVKVAEAKHESAEQQVSVAASQRTALGQQVRVVDAQIRAARLQAAGSRSALATAADLAGYTRVTAPFDGVVTERLADPGAFVQSAAGNQASARGIVKVVADRRLRVLIPVPETSYASVHQGTAVAITLDAYPKDQFTGTVTRTSAAVDPKSRTVLTEVEIPNVDGRLRPGMYARVTLTLEVHRGALTVPSEAVMGKEDRFVYVIDGGKAHKTAVEVGVDDGKVAEITSGLQPGATVVVVGRDTLVDGATVKTEPAPAPKK